MPLVPRPELKQRIPLLSIRVLSPESETTRKKVETLYVRYINESGFFGRVISEDIRSPYHIDIYTASVNEYEHFWMGTISTIFMAVTAGLLPSIYTDERILRADFFVADRFVGREQYRQRSSTLFGLPFFLIWEKGIQESKTIQLTKEKNMINNMIRDFNRYL